MCKIKYDIALFFQAGLELNCSRCDFKVLNWNQNSINFYERQGAYDQTKAEGLHSFRSEIKKAILIHIFEELVSFT